MKKILIKILIKITIIALAATAGYFTIPSPDAEVNLIGEMLRKVFLGFVIFYALVMLLDLIIELIDVTFKIGDHEEMEKVLFSEGKGRSSAVGRLSDGMICFPFDGHHVEPGDTWLVKVCRKSDASAIVLPIKKCR